MLLWWGSIFSAVMELQLIYESQEMIVMIFYSHSVSSLFSTISHLLFHCLWWISCHQKVFSTVVCFALDIFTQSFCSLPCSHALEHKRRQVSSGLDFCVCIGLTWQGFGRGLLWGRLVQGWFLWKFSHVRELLVLPAPRWTVVQAVPFHLNSDLFLEEKRDLGISLWHVEWNNQVNTFKCFGLSNKNPAQSF